MPAASADRRLSHQVRPTRSLKVIYLDQLQESNGACLTMWWSSAKVRPKWWPSRGLVCAA